MTTEVILLLTIVAFLMLGGLLNPLSVAFRDSGPKLGARMERHISTGRGFNHRGIPGQKAQWDASDGPVPGVGGNR